MNGGRDMNRETRNDAEIVQDAAQVRAERLRDKDIHPTYRATCCGKKDFIVNKKKLVYVCKHCGTQFKLDIWKEIE